MKPSGLSLIKAHKTGRRYRRPSWKNGFYTLTPLSSIMFEDALAVDYVLEPKNKHQRVGIMCYILIALLLFSPVIVWELISRIRRKS